jgi:hypothetical protein
MPKNYFDERIAERYEAFGRTCSNPRSFDRP